MFVCVSACSQKDRWLIFTNPTRSSTPTKSKSFCKSRLLCCLCFQPVLKRPDRSSLQAQRAALPRKRQRPGTSVSPRSTNSTSALRRKRLLENQRELQARRAAKLQRLDAAANRKPVKRPLKRSSAPVPEKSVKKPVTSGIQFPTKPKPRVILPRPMRRPPPASTYVLRLMVLHVFLCVVFSLKIRDATYYFHDH